MHLVSQIEHLQIAPVIQIRMEGVADCQIYSWNLEGKKRSVGYVGLAFLQIGCDRILKKTAGLCIMG